MAEYTEVISEVFNHPFVILLLGALVGKFYFLPRLLKEKDISYKVKAVEKIVDIKNIIKEIEFLHNRASNTLKDSVSDKKPINKDLINREIEKMSKVLNEKLPLQKTYLDTEIEAYFQHDKKVRRACSGYVDKLKELHDFIIELPKKHDMFKIKLSEYEEVREINFTGQKKSYKSNTAREINT